MMQENIQITEFTNVEIFFIDIKFQQRTIYDKS